MGKGAVRHLAVQRDLQGGGGLVPGLAVHLHGDGLQQRDARGAALRQLDGPRQPDLQLPQVPAAMHPAHLRAATGADSGTLQALIQDCAGPQLWGTDSVHQP